MAANNRSQALFDTFDRLSTREKIMVGGLLFALLAFLGGGAYIVIGGQIDDLEERNESIRGTLSQVHKLKAGFLQKKARLDAMRSKLENNPVRLVQLMETEAGHQGFEIENFKETKTFITNKHRQFRKRGKATKKKTVRDLVEESQRVTIRRISLEQLSNFMAALENRKEPVKVTGLVIDTLNSDRQVLRRVQLTVSTYRYEEVEI